MNSVVQRGGLDGVKAMTRYGFIASFIGWLTVIPFAWFGLSAQDELVARWVLAVGGVVQWAAFLILFPSARRALKADAQFSRQSRDKIALLYIAVVGGLAGWIFLFLCTLFGAYASDILAPLGLPADLWVFVALIVFLLPAVVLLSTIAAVLKGIENAR